MKKPILLLAVLAISIILLGIIFPSNSGNINASHPIQPQAANNQSSGNNMENYWVGGVHKIDSSGTALLWSHDNSILYYSKPGGEGGQELWASDANGNRQRLAEDEELYNISCVKMSPDGTKLSFVSTHGSRSRLYVYTIAGGELKNATPKNVSDVGVVSYDWDDESSNIIMAVDIAKPKIYLYNLISGKWGRVDIDAKSCTEIAFYKKGKILYADRHDGSYVIYSADLSGRNTEPVAEGRNFLISHDRNKIAILSDGYGQYGLWVYNLSTGDRKELLSIPVHDVFWIHNGGLMYSTEEDCSGRSANKGSIYMMQSDGMVIPITRVVHPIFVPSGDGTVISMTSPDYIEDGDIGIFIGKLYK